MAELTQPDPKPAPVELRSEPRQLDPDTVVFLDPRVAEDVKHPSDNGKFTGLLLPLVFDESNGGTALIFENRPHLAVQDEILLTQNAVTRKAIVRNIVQLDDGSYRLGFQWCAE